MNTSGEDDDTTRRKRRRVGQACNRCRHGKLKCNGAKPSCQKCSEANKPCSYGATVKKRGLRTGYVRALECLWGLTFDSVQGSRDTVEKLLLSKPGWSSWIRDDSYEGQGEENPLSTWRSSLIPQIIDSLLTPDKEKDDGGLVLPAVSEEPSLEDLSWVSQSIHVAPQPPVSPEIPRNSDPQNGNRPGGGNIEQIGNTSAPVVPEPRAINNLFDGVSQPTHDIRPELPRNAQLLLNRFFSMTHPWMPVFQRHSVFRSLFEYRRQSNNATTSAMWKTGDNALLWAIFAYSTVLHSFSNDVGEITSQSPSTISKDIYRTARDMIPTEDEGKYTTGHVQAFLVLALLQYSSRQWPVASLIAGQAMLVAKHIGLDQPFLTTEEQQRTWLGCFALDTLTSLHTGQKPCMRSSQVKNLLPLNTMGNDEWEPWHLQQALLLGVATEVAEFDEPTHAISVYSQQLEILCIINDSIYSNADGHSAETLKQDYLSWEKKLPDHIRTYQRIENRSSVLPSNILHLQVLEAFLQCRISSRQPFDWTNETRSIWLVVLEASERFLQCFREEILPPACNLLRNIPLRQPPPINPPRILTLIQQIRAENPFTETHPKGGIETLGTTESLGEFLSLSALNKNESSSSFTSSYPLDPRIQQNFNSFMGPPESWSQPTASNLILDPIELGDLHSLTAMLSQHPDGTIEGASEDGDLHNITAILAQRPDGTVGDPSEDVPLTYFSGSEDVDVNDRDQFRKNLGFNL